VVVAVVPALGVLAYQQASTQELVVRVRGLQLLQQWQQGRARVQGPP
jgi:hypothetical protein